jgi:NAD-dependent DNA ligase
MEKIVNDLNNSDDLFDYINKLSIDNLEKIITYASDKYYNEEPVISDAIFDMLRDFLQMKSPKSKVLKNIGAEPKVTKSKDKVKLPYYLGSMDKIKPPSSKLVSWCEKYSAPYILTDKLDGVSALLWYKDNSIKLYTRGTATHGMDISILLNYIKHIPSYEDVIKKFKTDNIAFRGELIISKDKFEKKWASSMKNARNAVAGLVNSKTINPELAHDTSLVLYQIIDPVFSITEQLKIIKEIGFKTVHSKKLDELSFDKLSKYLLKRREKSKYVIDGIIVSNNEIHPINKEGNPEYAWAFKDVLEDQKAKSKVVNIEWNQTKDGYIVPTIIIEPVDVGGVTIKRITGNNAKFIVDNKIGINAEVEIIRSNDVIPKIEKVIKGVNPILPPGDWEWQESGVHIINKDKETDEIKIKNIYYFFSTIGVMGLGEKIVEKLFNAGYDDILSILKITVDDIKEIEGFKQKSAENLVASINNNTNNIPLAILMKASNKLGRGMGEERAKSVLEKYPNIMQDYKKYNEEQFINMLRLIDGWEEKTSTTFAKNFKTFIDFYESIKNYISVDTSVKEKVEGKLSGYKIVMSGFRDKDLEELIEDNGGIISSGVSKNTNILIIKDESVMDTGKVVKAKELGVKIYTIDTFKKFMSK